MPRFAKLQDGLRPEAADDAEITAAFLDPEGMSDAEIRVLLESEA
jgi:hypothetical protein